MCLSSALVPALTRSQRALFASDTCWVFGHLEQAAGWGAFGSPQGLGAASTAGSVKVQVSDCLLHELTNLLMLCSVQLLSPDLPRQMLLSHAR